MRAKAIAMTMITTAGAETPAAAVDTTTSLDLFRAVRRLKDPRLGWRHRLMLFTLVSFREKDGTISPASEQLVAASGVCRATVFRSLGELEALGYVSRTHRGRYLSSLFTLSLDGAKRTQRETSPRETPRPLRKTPAVSPVDPLWVSISVNGSNTSSFSPDRDLLAREEEQVAEQALQETTDPDPKRSETEPSDTADASASHEVLRAASDEHEAEPSDAAVATAFYEVLKATGDELVMVPPLSMHDPVDVARVRALVAYGMTPAMFALAAAGATLKSKGPPSVAYVCKTLEHFRAHVARKRTHDEAETKRKQREVCELARLARLQDEPARDATAPRDASFAVEAGRPTLVVSRAPGGRVSAPWLDTYDALREAALKGELIPPALRSSAA